jgi:hypothetical protein
MYSPVEVRAGIITVRAEMFPPVTSPQLDPLLDSKKWEEIRYGTSTNYDDPAIG